jgi:hypothetical protein
VASLLLYTRLVPAAALCYMLALFAQISSVLGAVTPTLDSQAAPASRCMRRHLSS